MNPLKAPGMTYGSAALSREEIEFGRVGVEVSLMAVYCALRLLDSRDADLRSELHSALEDAASRHDRCGLRAKAWSGMPDALLPFKRDSLDVLLAAGLMGQVNSAIFRGEGTAVNAGYFHCRRGESAYVDLPDRVLSGEDELLDFEKIQQLFSYLNRVTAPVVVETGDNERGHIFILRQSVQAPLNLQDHLTQHGSYPSAARKYAIRLLSLQADSVVCVARGEQALPKRLGVTSLEKTNPEMLMEMHAAQLAAEDQGRMLWLSLSGGGIHVLAPLPDLLTPGSQQVGWKTPILSIRDAIGGDETSSTIIPRWVAVRLMRRYTWFWLSSTSDWVRCAQWLHDHGEAPQVASSEGQADAPCLSAQPSQPDLFSS